MNPSLEKFLTALNARLDKGQQEYGNASFGRRVVDAERELKEELIDQVGWAYIMWGIASQKVWSDITEPEMRATFFQNLRHRIARNDRGNAEEPPYRGAASAMVDLEILAMDMFQAAEGWKQRLFGIARAIEVARWMAPVNNGRRGGACDPRSSD